MMSTKYEVISEQSLSCQHGILIVLLLLYATVAVLYGALIPIFETPDANGHYAYIHELTEGRGLPIHDTPSGDRVTGYVAGHVPLYYALCAAFTFWVPDDVDYDDWAWRNPHHAMGNAAAVANKNRLIHTQAEAFPWRGTPLTMHIARLVSTALGAVAVVGAYGIARELFPARRWLALSVAALTAFNPMFLFTSARVSNDVAVAAFGSLTIWAAVRLTVRGLSRRGLALAGLALGLTALSKLSGIALAPALALALLLDVLRVGHYKLSHLFRKDQLKRLLINGAVLFGVTFAVCGWWYVRNLILYGELMGVDAWLSRTATVWPEPIGFFDVLPFLKDLEISYWAMFGWFNIAAAPWMYRVWWVLVRLAALGLLIIVVEQWTSRRFPRAIQMGIVVVGLAFMLIFGSVWRFIMIVPGAQGRYLMPVTAAIATLLVLGLSRLIPHRATPGLTLLLGIGHLVMALICLFVFILPAYAGPVVVQESDLPPDLVRFDVTFDGTSIELLGGEIEGDSIYADEVVEVSLYWRAAGPIVEDLTAFVQILGREGNPVAGIDCYPGRGNFPTTLWEPGVIYRDQYQFPIAQGARVPTVAGLHVGFRRDGQRLDVRYPSGDVMPQPALFDLVALRPAEQPSVEIEHSVSARLGEAITLVGYGLSAETVQPGETVTVTLVWRADASPEGDYTAFVHLIDEAGNLIAQDDHPPLSNEYRTSFWVPGDVVRDTYRLSIPSDQPPCECLLGVGMYDPLADVRLPAFDGLGGRFPGDVIPAGGLDVE